MRDPDGTSDDGLGRGAAELSFGGGFASGGGPSFGAGDSGAGERRVLDPEQVLQHARDLCWRSLNRRDRTEAELRRMLAQKRVEPEVIETVVGELLDGGFVDDALYARRFAEDRRRLDAWGSERIARKLASLGIARGHIDAAVGDQDEGAELEAAVGILERRVREVPRTRLERDRALGLLLRRGYEPEVAFTALRRFAGVTELD